MKSKKLGKLYKDGEIIVKQGDKGKCLYVIQEGRVDVIHETPEGEKKVAELDESDFFGEMGLFEDDVRSCTIRAAGDVRILTIDKRNFFKSINRNSTLAYRLLEKMSNRLREANEKINKP